MNTLFIVVDRAKMPMNLREIEHSLRNNELIHSTLNLNFVVSTWTCKLWVWIKKCLGFASAYKIAFVAQATLRQLELQAQSPMDIARAKSVLRLLLNKTAHLHDAALTQKLQQKREEILQVEQYVAMQALAPVYLTLPEKFQLNFEIAKTAMDQDHSIVTYLPPSLKKNKRLALDVVSKHGLDLQYFDPTLQDDFDVVLAAVTQNGWALAAASAQMKANSTIAKAACLQHPFASFLAAHPETSSKISTALVGVW